MRAKMIQTADPVRYAPFLTRCSLSNRRFCELNGFEYQAFVGIKHGRDPWHATFNRIDLLSDEIRRGYRGWILYLDADAYVADPQFDALAYLTARNDYGLIALPVRSGGPGWDVNAGILFFNTHSSIGRETIMRWKRLFDLYRRTPLYRSPRIAKLINDQVLLQLVLRTSSRLRDGVYLEDLSIINGPGSIFVRQLLRIEHPDLARRIEKMERLVQEALARLE